MTSDSDALRGFPNLDELRIQRIRVHPDLRVEGHPNRFDPHRWPP